MELINTREAADLLGVSRQRLHQMVAEGKLKPALPRIPGQISWFRREDVEKLAEKDK